MPKHLTTDNIVLDADNVKLRIKEVRSNTEITSLDISKISNFKLYNNIIITSANGTKYKLKINSNGLIEAENTTEAVLYNNVVIKSGNTYYKLIVSDSGVFNVTSTTQQDYFDIFLESDETYPRIYKLVVVNSKLEASPISSGRDYVLSGSGTFGSVYGTSIAIGKTLLNNNYRVTVTPTSNPEGSLGEIWIANKTTTSFRVYCSGSTTTCTFDWMVHVI